MIRVEWMQVLEIRKLKPAMANANIYLGNVLIFRHLIV